MNIKTAIPGSSTSLPDEVELKLTIAADDMARLIAEAALSGTTPKVIHQVATYFDTPQQDLRNAGLSLRVRTAGARHVQTVKASGGIAAGLFARAEWERAVAGSSPELDGEAITAVVAPEILAAVVPTFTVRVTRLEWVVDQDGGIVEVVADTGVVTAGDRTTPVSELELELKGGSPTALFALARKLAAVTPLRLGVLTKGERGYRLIEPAVVGASKAERLVIEPGSTTAQAFAKIVGTCLRHFRLNEELLRQSPGPEALHQTRVALRRLRSALSIFKPLVADDRFPQLAAELKWLAATLGPARDLDVLRNRLGKVATAPLIAARDDAYRTALEALDSARTRDLMIDLVEWVALGQWRLDPLDLAAVQAPVVDFASTAIRALRRRMKRQGRTLDQLDNEARHRVRITAKKLRYATGFFQSVYDGKRSRRRFKAFARHLETLQDNLGTLNDLATAPALLERFGLDRESVLPSVDRRKILADASEAYQELLDAKRFW